MDLNDVYQKATQWVTLTWNQCPRKATESEVKAIQTALNARLSEVLPLSAPCGCCEIVGLNIRLFEVPGGYNLHLEPIQRPKTERLH